MHHNSRFQLSFQYWQDNWKNNWNANWSNLIQIQITRIQICGTAQKVDFHLEANIGQSYYCRKLNFADLKHGLRAPASQLTQTGTYFEYFEVFDFAFAGER
jgi:hypothetical protein